MDSNHTADSSNQKPAPAPQHNKGKFVLYGRPGKILILRVTYGIFMKRTKSEILSLTGIFGQIINIFTSFFSGKLYFKS